MSRLPELSPGRLEQRTQILREYARRSWWAWRVPVAAAIPLFLYLVLRPEAYGGTPNSLDTFFYTGYAINFDDMMREVGGGYYFVSRWTAYMPSRLFAEIFGPVLGRLVLRWLIATAMLLSVWRLGRRWSWPRSTEILVGVVVTTCPMFARAFLTDYVEWFIASVGFILFCQCLLPPKPLRSAANGALAAAIVISNPLASVVVAAPIAVYGLRCARRGWRSVARESVWLVCAGVGLIIAGLAWYRAKYGIANVYQPTIDFLRTRSGGRDLLKSPSESWMGSFLWIYAPPILLVGAVILAPVRERIRGDAVAVAAALMLAGQYVFQWMYQFAADGTGLEIEYYWCLIYPSFLATTAVIVGSHRWTSRQAAAVAAMWLVLLVACSRNDVNLPAGWAFLILALAVVGVLVAWQRVVPHLVAGVPMSISSVLVLILLTQVAAPNYAPPAGHTYNVDPRFDKIFWNPDSATSQAFREAVWFEDEADAVDDKPFFMLATDATASSILGIYGAHVTGKLIQLDAVGDLPTSALARMALDEDPRLLVYGAAEQVEAVVARLINAGSAARVHWESKHRSELGYEAWLLDIADPAHDEFWWPAASIPSQTGRPEGETVVLSPRVDAPGFALFGPYVRLTSGTYTVRLDYRSEAETDEEVGWFDVARNGEPISASPMPGTGGDLASVELTVQVEAGTGWEFRMYWTGDAETTVIGIESAPGAAGR